MMNKTRQQLLMVTLALIQAACPGCPPQTQLINQTRKIAVDVCKAEPNINDKGGVEDCTVDFDQAGTVNSLTVRVTREITITNVGEEDLVISGYEKSSDTDPSFLVEHFPTGIKPGLSSKMVVSFRPMLASQVGGKITLMTNAENAKEGTEQVGQVEITIKGSGVDNGTPQLKVEVVDGDTLASCCDLGSVAVGSISNCQLRITNVGNKALVLDEVAFDASATDGPWAPVGALPNPTTSDDDARFTIEPGEANAKVLSFKFQPTDTAPHAARVLIRSNAPKACGPVGELDGNPCIPRTFPDPCASTAAGTATVNLRGQGAEPPTCVARIKSVNGSTQFDPRLIEPLDDVEITAEDSTTNVPGATITAYKWSVLTRPQGSRVAFANDEAVSTHFVFENTSTNTITGLDVAGSYEVRCEAVDSLGTRSVNDGPAILLFEATPSEAIHVQLVWDAPETDVDLHLVRENPTGTYQRNSENDCYYANCKPTTSTPIWDPANPAHQGGNPVLDVDDVEGYGPENSNINEPVPGTYSVLVHYFSDHGHGPTVGTLRLYLYGNLVAEYSQLINDGEWWNVGNVSWPSMGIGTWNEVNTVSALP